MVKTWEFLLLIIVVMITGTAFAKTFTTITGQGYYSWNGQVISYYNFTPNSTFNLNDGETATDTKGDPDEVINQQAFNSYICLRSGKC